MKVVNKEVLALKRKLQRAETETLHTEFEATHFSCVVMEFCPGGDLHSLRHKQPHKRFSIRFSSLQGSFTSNSVLRSLFCDIVAKSIRLSINKLLSLKSFHVRLMSIVLDVDVKPTTTPWYSAKAYLFVPLLNNKSVDLVSEIDWNLVEEVTKTNAQPPSESSARCLPWWEELLQLLIRGRGSTSILYGLI